MKRLLLFIILMMVSCTSAPPCYTLPCMMSEARMEFRELCAMHLTSRWHVYNFGIVEYCAKEARRRYP